MDRRAFIAGTLGVLTAPLAAEAQSAGQMYRIGYLWDVAPPQALFLLEESPRELGYVEGRNLVVERRFAAFKYDRLPDLAAELVPVQHRHEFQTAIEAASRSAGLAARTWLLSSIANGRNGLVARHLAHSIP